MLQPLIPPVFYAIKCTFILSSFFYLSQEARNNACPSCPAGSYENLAHGECVSYDKILSEYNNLSPTNNDITYVSKGKH